MMSMKLSAVLCSAVILYSMCTFEDIMDIVDIMDTQYSSSDNWTPGCSLVTSMAATCSLIPTARLGVWSADHVTDGHAVFVCIDERSFSC